MTFSKPIGSVIFLLYFSQLTAVFVLTSQTFNDIDLPESQLPFYYNNFPKAVAQCLSNDSCKHRSLLQSDDYDGDKCWGYEPGCSFERSYSVPKCAAEKPTWIKSDEEYVNAFYDQGDFGEQFDYVCVLRQIGDYSSNLS